MEISNENGQVCFERVSYRLSELVGYLERRIIGQRPVLTRIARAIQASELGLNEITDRPKASFLFLGPTGVGKTETAKTFSEFLYGTRSRMEIFFMNEYSNDNRSNEFLARLEEAILKSPEGNTLLFDEIEKSTAKLIDLFLSLIEEGQFTGLSNQRRSIRNFYVVLTSNLGSGDLAKMENAPYTTLERVALDVASQSLRPELFARITEKLVFRPLNLEFQREIVENLVQRKLSVLQHYFGCALTIDRGPVLAFLLRTGFSKNQGARHVRQEVDRQFNAASLPFALEGEQPLYGLYRYDSGRGCLVLS